MKKSLYFIVLSFFAATAAPLLNAQTIEQISYVPVKKGNYASLIVKKKANFGGDLLVKNAMHANSTIVNMTTNKISLSDGINFQVNSNIFLHGTTGTFGNVNVAADTRLIIVSPAVTIGTLQNTVNIAAENLTANQNAAIGELYIDGVKLDVNCTLTWINVEAANKGGTYKILGCQ